MFPFNLAGPQFLAFYVAFTAVVLAVYWFRLASDGRSAGGLGRPRVDELATDPYRVACLRAGPDEAVRLAVINLIDRDLLVEAKGSALRTTLKSHPEAQRRTLDRVILERCAAAPMSAADLLADAKVRAAAAELDTDLQHKGLLHEPDEHAARRGARRWALLVLAGVAVARLVQAFANGRTNVFFLVVLAGLACLAVVLLPNRRTTRAGRKALANLETLLGRVKRRADQIKPGGVSNEAMLVAAVFGVYALPAQAFPFVEQHFPKPVVQSDSGSGGGSDSSSCGSSSSCGGGGGCGGCGGGGGD